MSSKLTFRARTLDSSRPLAIFLAQDLPELVDLNSINRAVPALPTGMEKEEETEKHLQDILVAQGQGHVGNTMVIPTPGCSTITSTTVVIPTPECGSPTMSPTSQYNKIYNKEFKQPRQYIHVQPFGPSQDVPDYDMDEEDIKFFQDELKERRKLEVLPLTFEDMIDRLEKNSTQNVVTLKEAKLILKEDDDLILIVYDYWLNKRLAIQQSLMPGVKNMNITSSTPQSPYIAFRRRTEKMQTRKNRKNEEASYGAMLKLRRDLSRAVTLLEMVKRREKTKKEKLNLTLDVFDKRYDLKDFDGKLVDYANLCRPKTVQPLNIQSWMSMGSPPHKRTYKNRKHHRSGQRSLGDLARPDTSHTILERKSVEKIVSSEDETVNVGSDEETVEDTPFLFRRKEGAQYLAPVDDFGSSWGRNNNPCDAFSLTTLPNAGTIRCLGYCRRRVGRGGRVIVDRITTRWDNLWEKNSEDMDWHSDELVIRPVTPPHLEDIDWDPYLMRGQEVQVGSHVDMISNNNKGFRIVDMNKSLAHNAAGALVDSQFVEDLCLLSTASNTILPTPPNTILLNPPNHHYHVFPQSQPVPQASLPTSFMNKGFQRTGRTKKFVSVLKSRTIRAKLVNMLSMNYKLNKKQKILKKYISMPNKMQAVAEDNNPIKNMKNKLERERRLQLAMYRENLKNMVPSTSDIVRVSTVTVIRAAWEHCVNIQEEISRLQENKMSEERRRQLLTFKVGWLKHKQN